MIKNRDAGLCYAAEEALMSGGKSLPLVGVFFPFIHAPTYKSQGFAY